MPNYDILRQGLYKIPFKIINRERVFTFFQNKLFGGRPIISDKTFIAMDYASYGVRILEEAVRGADPKRVNYGSAFDENLIRPNYFFVKDSVNLNNADHRVSMDEPLDAPWSVQERELYLIADKRDKMGMDLIATKEKLCHDVLFTGKFTTKGQGEQKFPLSTDLLSIPGTDFATKPNKCIANAVAKVIKYGYRPVSLILNPDDALALADSEAWQKFLDNRRVEGNAIAYKPIDDDGVAYIGTISVQGGGQLNLYSYLGTYLNGDVPAYLVPKGSALLVPERVGCMGYAGVLHNDGSGVQKVIAQDVAYHVWGNEDGPLVESNISMQSSPAPIITAIDGYGVITGITV